MTRISKEMPVADLAALVCQRLADHGIEAVLTGGSVVTIYSDNEYASDDLDFISTARQKHIASAMATLGFKPAQGKHFEPPDTDLFVEFPAPPLAIGNEPVTQTAEQRCQGNVLKLLTPTQCVMITAPVELTFTSAPSAANAGAVVLTLTVRALTDIPSGVARVVLPAQIKLLSGQSEIPFGALPKDAERQFSLTVDATASGRFQIFAGVDCHISSGISYTKQPSHFLSVNRPALLTKPPPHPNPK